MSTALDAEGLESANSNMAVMLEKAVLAGIVRFVDVRENSVVDSKSLRVDGVLLRFLYNA